MRPSPIAFVIACVSFLFVFPLNVARAQYEPPSERLTIRTNELTSWNAGETVILQSDGPITIETERATLTARGAVIWLTPLRGRLLEQQQAEIALIGDAKLEQPSDQLTRSGDRLFVTLAIRGSVRVTAEHRLPQNRADSELFTAANRMRPLGGNASSNANGGASLIQRPWVEVPPSMGPPTTVPTTQRVVREPVNFRADNIETIQTAENHVAFVLQGNVIIYQRRATGELVELQANRAVLFTPFEKLRDASEGNRFRGAEDAIDSAYLEGDVRVAFTPVRAKQPEQRMQAEQVFYEFTTDRAVLTRAVVHTVDPNRNLPITIRAELVRQMSAGEYRADDVEMSTSQFQTPSYSFKASRMYVRQVDTGDARYGNETQFVGHHATFDLFGAPFFYLPVLAGSMTDRGSALRSAYLEQNTRNGIGVRTDWGLFETVGVLPPRDLDIDYRLDYFEKRGPAVGTTANYQGGYITETTREAWDFKGRATAYVLNDHGDDRLGSQRRTVTPDDDIRGHVLWEHQHFFPGDWQVQLRAGYTSDPTFLEEFFEREFDTGQPHELTAYLKRQRDSEALTLLFEYPTNDFTTTADELQEQAQIERLPEVGYRRIGDSIADDQLTFFSENRLGFLRFKQTDNTLAEQGFRPGQSPGIASFGYTGTDDSRNLRGDFRQEIDYPLSTSQLKIVPYAFGRYTSYSDTPADNSKYRLFVGSGVRINTAFWKVDDSAQSKLFDINRLRHVVEPEINLFTSAQTRDQNDLFIYDEDVDAINDVSAIQLALHQRWQTKRGGAGSFRSVDFFTFNVEANLFSNQPDEALQSPRGFRGLFFNSMPEASLARNSLNADALWRVSDETAILADASYNFDRSELATTSIGVAVQRDPRVSYFAGVRYIGQINSTIASVAANYELSAKYTLAFSQSFSLSDRKNQDSRVTIIRHFDRLFVSLTLYYDAIDNTSGFSFGIIPEGLGTGVTSDAVNQVVGPQ